MIREGLKGRLGKKRATTKGLKDIEKQEGSSLSGGTDIGGVIERWLCRSEIKERVDGSSCCLGKSENP